MLKNKVIGIFLLFFALQLSAMAISSYYKNFLNTIEIKKESLNKYSVNLKFNHNYSEPLAIQQKGKNLYSIVLPETKKSGNSFNIIKDKNADKITMQIAEYPYLDQSIDNGYVKIILKTQGNISLTATTPAKTLEENQTVETPKKDYTQKTITKTLVAQKPAETAIKAPIKSKQEVQAPIKEITPVITDTTGIVEQQAEKQVQKPKRTNLFDFIIGLSLCLLTILIVGRKIKHKLKQQPSNDRFFIEPSKPFEQAQDTGFKNEFKRLQEKEKEINKITSVEDEIGNKIKLIKGAKIIEKEEPKPSQPDLVSNIPIDRNKGFYLVNVEGKTALIGYINDEIFIINRFNDIKDTNLQTRLNEKQKDKSTYIVRLGDYKALIEVSNDNMSLVVEL